MSGHGGRSLVLDPGGKPPPAWVKPNHERPRRKKPGAREGHEAHNREPTEPEEEVDVTLVVCPECDSALGEPLDVRERIVEDVVPARLKTTRYWVHRYWCPECKTKVEARPAGVLPGQRFGLALMLLVCYLRVLGLTWEKIREYYRESFDLDVSHGALVHMEEVVAEALGQKYADLLEEVRRAKSVHADDTGWRVDGKNRWLWTLASKHAAYYTVQRTRSGRVITDHLGEAFDGVVVTDFYPGYANLPYDQQKCLVHLLREVKRFEAKQDFVDSKEWRDCKRWLHRLVGDARRAQERLADPLARAEECGALMARAASFGEKEWTHKYAKTLGKLVGQYHEHLFTFLAHDQVAWENNHAERALRPMVVNRKMSFGSRSTEGAQRRCVVQSVAQSARLRDEPFLAYARDAIDGFSGSVPGS